MESLRPTLRQEVVRNFMLAYPVMLSQLGHVMMGVVDNMMVGHLDAEALAAAGLANVLFNVLFLFGIGVSYCITPLVAHADGTGDTNEITRTLRHGLVINMVNAAILTLIILSCRTLLLHIGQPEEVVNRSLPYLSIIAWSLLPAMIFQSFRQFSEGLSNTWLPMTIVIASNVLNIGLNYLFIYGHGGFPAWGLEGAGYATLISRIAMAIALTSVVFFARRFRPYRGAFRLSGFSRPLFSKMLHIGLPAGLQFIFEVAAFDFSLVMMGWFGTSVLAAHQIAINLATVSYMTTSGLAAAATIRVSNELGRGDIPALRRAAFVLMGMAMALMSCWAVLFISANHTLPLLYVDDPGVVPMAATLIIIAGLFQLSDGMQVVCASALRGIRDVKVPSLLIFVAYWLIGLPLGYVLGFTLHIGPVGIWIGLLTGLTITATALFIRFRIKSRTATPS